MKAYQSYLMVGRYPVSALFIEIPAEEVDVNVHPAKAEVRFRQPDLVFAYLQRAVRRALLAYSPVPSLSPAIWKLPVSEVPRPPSKQMTALCSMDCQRATQRNSVQKEKTVRV